jgi:hypothetical protein
LDTVVPSTDLPVEKLRKGSLGTVIETFEDASYLVEFANLEGVTYVIPVLTANQLIKVYQEAVDA